MSELERDGISELNSYNETLNRDWGLENFNFPYSAIHGEGWQPYPPDAQSDEVISVHIL